MINTDLIKLQSRGVASDLNIGSAEALLSGAQYPLNDHDGSQAYCYEFSHIGQPFEDTTLRQKIIDGMQLFENKGINPNIIYSYLSDGYKQLSSKDIQSIRTYLTQLCRADSASQLGVTPKMKSIISVAINSLPSHESQLDEMAPTLRRLKQESLGISAHELKFRQNMYKVNPHNSQITYIVNQLYDKGVLSDAVSDIEIGEVVLEYVKSNYTYQADKGLKSSPETGEAIQVKCDHWQEVSETIAKKSGDCEDLAILMASLLSNIFIGV